MNDELKEKILIKDGWEVTEGYTFNTSDEADNIVLSVKDLEEALKKKPEKYYWHDSYDDSYVDLDSAWDNFLDEFCDKPENKDIADSNLTEEQLNELLEKQYKKEFLGEKE